MYVCICNAITDADIAAAAAEGVRNVAELGDRLGVGTNCGTCQDMAQTILDACSPATTHYRNHASSQSGVFLYSPSPAI